jgi:segregation and condensation protein B
MEQQTDHAAEQSLERILEAVLSASDSPVSAKRLSNLFPEEARPELQQIESALAQLATEYECRALELIKLSSGYRFQTRAVYSQWINKLFETRPPKLSRALLETLAVIAYQQPATRSDIQDVRGVAVSSELIQKLLERQWIKKIGERDVPGRPSLFATTFEFLEYFNLSSLKDLPELHEPRELDEIARDLGQSLESSSSSTESDASKVETSAQAAISDDKGTEGSEDKGSEGKGSRDKTTEDNIMADTPEQQHEI